MKDILTEAEAKERWCPLVRVFDTEGDKVISANRSLEGVPIGSCIASACMAWRLAHKDGPDGSERGYCGAFGMPRFT